MTRSDLGALVLLGVTVAVFFLVRRYTPAATCPHCGSRSWILWDDNKQCRNCGRLFY